jgi:hypothetical protein
MVFAIFLCFRVNAEIKNSDIQIYYSIALPKNLLLSIFNIYREVQSIKSVFLLYFFSLYFAKKILVKTLRPSVIFPL